MGRYGSTGRTSMGSESVKDPATTSVSRFSLDLFSDRFWSAPHKPSNRLGQAAPPAQRRGDREQEVVGLYSKCVCGRRISVSPNRSRRAEKSITIRWGITFAAEPL